MSCPPLGVAALHFRKCDTSTVADALSMLDAHDALQKGVAVVQYHGLLVASRNLVDGNEEREERGIRRVQIWKGYVTPS